MTARAEMGRTDMNALISTKARLEHQCTACGQPIYMGAQYWRWNHPDGVVRMHPECYTARAEGLTKKVAS